MTPPEGYEVVRRALERAPGVLIPKRGQPDPRRLNRTELLTLVAALAMSFEPGGPTIDRLAEVVDVAPVELCRALAVLERADVLYLSELR